MQLFYTPNICPPEYILSEEESRHCVRVLRLGDGDRLYLTDGRGNLFLAEVTDANPKQCSVRVVETFAEFEKRGYNLTMAVAPTKNPDRYEWFLEKATETGVDRFIPIDCAHSERRKVNRERMERVITSAVKQSLKAYHPALDELTPVKEILAGTFTNKDGTPFAGRKLIAHCRDGERRFIGDCITKGEDVMILIGPEGDFSQGEVDAAVANGFTPVTLGPGRLRTETAAIAAATIVAFINNG